MTLLWDISLKTSEDQIIKPLFACKTSKKQTTTKKKIRQLFRLGEIKQCATDFFSSFPFEILLTSESERRRQR